MPIRSLVSAALTCGAVVGVASLVASGQTPAMPMEMPTKAVAVFIPTKGSTVAGTVTFTKVEKGTRVVAELTGVPGRQARFPHP